MKHYPRIIITRIAIMIVFIVSITYSCLHTNQTEIKKTNQFALLSRYSPEEGKSYLVPLKIEDGILYRCSVDGEWTVVELEGKASQVFSGENLFVLMEDGSVYYDGMTEPPKPENGENFSLTAGYSVMMAKKTLELNESVPFVAVNQNMEYLDFRALLSSGEIMYRSYDVYEGYTLPEESVKELSGEFLLTEDGDVYYLHTDLSHDPVRSEPEKLYDGGDIVAISACATDASCIGIKESGEVVSWVGSSWGWNKTWSYDVSEWRNITAVREGSSFAVGLDAEGRVHFAMDNEKRQAAVSKDLNEWSDVTEIAVLGQYIAGMKADGSCLFLDLEEYAKYWKLSF